tara:strand:+ start:1852 stop:2502 length:651 start_codon:yes stop_codon:yes gene_type:complete
MQRRDISNEAGARSDGLLMVSVIFITAFTYIALTTSPVYTGIGVDDRAPELNGQVWDGTSWTDFSLYDNVDSMWVEGDGGTYYMIEFMDTNCGICVNAAKDKIPTQQAKWLNEGSSRSMPDNVSVEFLAVSISLWNDGDSGKTYGRDVIETFRADYNHEFPYMDDQDNTNRDEWGDFGTPTYFLVDPSGIIKYVNLDAPAGQTVWDAMDDLIPRGE